MLYRIDSLECYYLFLELRMRIAAPLLWISIASAAPLLAQELDAEQTVLLEKTRETAMRYSSSLPDFICTQTVSRSEDSRGNNNWRQLDRLTIRLSYSDRREDYKLMKINGKNTTLDYLSSGGALSTGEFGTRLAAVFDPRSRAQFQWKGWTAVHKHRTARFTYQVDQQHTAFLLQYGDPAGESNQIVVPYHGEVLVDAESHMVLRLTQEADIPRGYPITFNESWVEYDYADVGGGSYLLPVRAYSRTKSGRYTAENNIQFREYRKFETETTITFDK
ncbi:MAG: hypothetical protein ABI759_02245 [Candidatus Solibacter sp.]